MTTTTIRNVTRLALLLIATADTTVAQYDARTHGSHSSFALMFSSAGGKSKRGTAPAAESREISDDPGYSLYKEGYAMILDEQWNDARGKFSQLISRFPSSEYRDDAEYWSAYALRHLNSTEAVNAYESFIGHYPHSKYLDDAVADLDQLRSDPLVVSTPGVKPYVFTDGKSGYFFGISTDSMLERINEFTLAQSALDLRKLERQLRRSGKELVRLPRRPMAAGAHTPPRIPEFWLDDETVDPQTRIKMDALSALGETRDDEQSFLTLKDVALDQRQPRPLRIAAVDGLSNFTKFDVVGVFVSIAKTDSNPDMQSMAVDYISSHGKDRNKSVVTLIDIFNNTSPRRKEQRRRIFYAIAENGNDRAVDFLAGVARSNEDYELRREAVFYLGSIGGEKARTALLGILKESK